MKVILTQLIEKPIDAIEAAASNCYNSTPSSSGKIMKHCFQSGHHSVLEFADFTFHIEGVSRALLAQITRHRIASFAVRSQRYCSEDGFGYVTPPSIQNNAAALVKYNDIMDYIKIKYEELQELNIPNEDARFILPNACETILEVKMSGRELIHFFNERLCSRAQWEIRNLAKEMLNCIKNYNEQCAQFAEMCGPKCEQFGKDRAFCPEVKGCGKYPTLKTIKNGYIENEENKNLKKKKSLKEKMKKLKKSR